MEGESPAEVEAVLLLREPDPMTELDAWSAWFDNLKSCTEAVAAAAAALGASRTAPLGSAPAWVDKKR